MIAEAINRLWAMSLQAAILILIVLAVRICLSRYSKIYSYCLWGLVGVKLLCPVWVESPFSLQPAFLTGNDTIAQAEHSEYTLPGFLTQPEPNFDTGILQEVQEDQSAAAPAEDETAKIADAEPPVWTIPQINEANLYGIVYCIGVAGFCFFYLVQYLCIRKRISSAVRDKGNVWLSDRITSPFVMGVIRPKIYLPYNISKRDKKHVLRHERMHIRHCDPFIRIIGTLCICLHWWNPLVWVGVRLMNQDMEMFCDESVLHHAPLEERKAYAKALLSFAEKNAGLGAGLAFGKSHTEKRIHNIMKKRRRSLWAVSLLVAFAAFCIIALLTVPMAEGNTDTPEAEGITQNTEAPKSPEPGINNKSAEDQIVLSPEALSYLEEVSGSIPDFTTEEEMDAGFWKYYLFYSYTSDFDREEVSRYSEQYGFDIHYVKVDYAEADETILRLFGKRLGEYGIDPETLGQGDSSLLYEDGVFFIAVSDSPLYNYTEENVTKTDILTKVSFSKVDENGAAFSQVILYLLPADNEQGFILSGKETIPLPAEASGTILDGQSYEVEMNPYGNVTFAVYAPDLSISPYADVTYKLLQDGKEIYSFPLKGTGIREDQSAFDGMAAVAFPDLNKDGYTDVITIAHYKHESGPVPSQARIFTYNEGGYFLEEAYLEAAFNESHETKTIEEIEAFAAQPENQDYFEAERE